MSDERLEGRGACGNDCEIELKTGEVRVLVTGNPPGKGDGQKRLTSPRTVRFDYYFDLIS